jgi:hypothetical protein
MSKFLIPQPMYGLVLTGPKKTDKQMFGGPLKAPLVGRQLWKTGEVLNQGADSSCVGFAWSQFLLSEPRPYKIKGTKPFDFATQIYKEAQKVDEFPGEEPEYFGTTVEAGYSVLHSRGLVSDEIEWATSIGQICQYINLYGPVVIGTNWYDSMMNMDNLGYVKPSGLLAAGGHCYLCYGFDAIAQDLLFINSWGPEWGIEGRFKMKFKDFQKLLNYGGYGIATFDVSK